MDNNERHRALATKSLEQLNRVFAGDAPEPDERPATLHEILRTVPNSAVAKWAAEGERAEVRRKAAREERKAQEEREVATKLAAIAAANNQGERDYLNDMLQVISAQQAAMQRLEERIAENAEMKASAKEVFDLPNPIASRRMQ